MAERVKDLVRSSDLPVLVDIDTGFGGVLNAARTAKKCMKRARPSKWRISACRKMRTSEWEAARAD